MMVAPLKGRPSEPLTVAFIDILTASWALRTLVNSANKTHKAIAILEHFIILSLVF
jgi:hypothetical protein